MAKLIPIRIDDESVIYIESTEDASTVGLDDVISDATDSDEQAPSKRGSISTQDAQKKAIQSFAAIEGTIRTYTVHTLKAFKNLAGANIDKVTLKFGVEIGGEAGIPYITKGTAKSNLNIEVECSFPKESAITPSP